MPVFECSTPGCDRCISISVAPGGNPYALAHPDVFSIVHKRCSGCVARFCDRCLAANAVLKQGLCSACGGKLEDPPPGEALKMMRSPGMPAGALGVAIIQDVDPKKRH